MKLQVLIAFFTFLTTVFAAPDFGIEVISEALMMDNMDIPYFEILESRTDDCDGTRRMLKCFNETAISLCTPGGQRIIHCRGLTPRCNPTLNVCVSGRADSPVQFTCPSKDGYYPDLSTCRKYYFCAKNKPMEYNCDLTDVYDPNTRSCVRHLPGNHCFRFNCFGKEGRFTPYPGEQNVYAICSGNHPVELFRCPEGHAMNEREQRCEPHCTKEGLIKDQTSCHKYHECTRNLIGYRVRNGECPPGAWFDPKFSHCRMLEDEKDCPQAAIKENEVTTPIPETSTTQESEEKPEEESEEKHDEESEEKSDEES